jgi:DNA-binding XRE family transcriptional regulator
MSTPHQRPELSQEQQAAIEAIRARARDERPGPDELIDQGELNELVPHAQYLAIRALGARMREFRERLGLSLNDVSKRSGLTRAAVSRLENGWKLNPTIETLFRYAEALGADLRLTLNAPADPAVETRWHGGKQKQPTKKR